MPLLRYLEGDGSARRCCHGLSPARGPLGAGRGAAAPSAGSGSARGAAAPLQEPG